MRGIKKSKYRLVIVSIVSFLALLFIVSSSFSVTNDLKVGSAIISDHSGYSVVGDFARDGTFPLKNDSDQIIKSLSENIALWGSWTGEDSHLGQLRSPTFEAPAILSLFVAGYPHNRGNELFVENIQTHEKLNLKVTELPGERWIEKKWILPNSWWGSSIQVVAIDGATEVAGWLGVSTPLSLSWLNLFYSQLPSLVIIPVYLVHFFLFLMPGILLAYLVKKRCFLDSNFTVILAITFSSLIGYISFWIYFLNQHLGIFFSICLILGTTIYTIHSSLTKRSKVLKFLLSKDTLLPILIMAVVGLFYLAILYIVETEIDSSQYPAFIAQNRLFSSLPPDNVLPMLFAERIYQGDDPRNLLGDWLSSDRPPLQTGIILWQRPIMTLTGLSYQTLGTIAQCSWIPALWTLCRKIKLSGRQIAVVFTFCIFSGFFLINSVYVWPKLLASALIIFALALLLDSFLKSRSLSMMELCLAAMATTLGLLAHGGVVFTFPAMFLLFIARWKTFPGWRSIAICLVVVFCLMSPWGAYQHFYNPPGNRLVKWHIGGVVAIDERSTSEAIFDSYRGLSLEEIVNNKLENTKILFSGISGGKDIFQAKRVGEFFHTFQSLGILNIGWVILLLNLILNSWWSKGKSRSVEILIGVGLISLATWILVMFGPSTTIIHQGSYANMIILFVSLSALLTRLPNLLVNILLALHIFLFFSTWILTTPARFSNELVSIFNIPMILLGTILLVGIFKTISRVSSSEFFYPVH